MKKLILMICLLTGSVAFANGQMMQKSPDQRAAHQTKMLQKKLNLTADQASRVNTILFAQANKMDSLRTNPAADKRTQNLTRRTLMRSTMAQLNALLDPSQQQKFKQWKEMQKEKHRSHKHDRVTTPDTHS